MSKKPTKPCPIPRDLKPGDVIVDSDGGNNVFRHYDVCNGKYTYANCDVYIFNMAGYAPPLETHAVSIIRKASKPAKVKADKDAVWLMRNVLGDKYACRTRNQRIRAIAKRLNNGVMP